VTGDLYDWNSVTLPWWFYNEKIHHSDAAVLYRKDKKHYHQFQAYDDRFSEYQWPHQIYDQLPDSEKQQIALFYHDVDNKERRYHRAYQALCKLKIHERIALCKKHQLPSSGSKDNVLQRMAAHLLHTLAADIVLDDMDMTSTSDNNNENHSNDHPMYHGRVHNTRMDNNSVAENGGASVMNHNDTNESTSIASKQQRRPNVKAKKFQARYSGHVETRSTSSSVHDNATMDTTAAASSNETTTATLTSIPSNEFSHVTTRLRHRSVSSLSSSHSHSSSSTLIRNDDDFTTPLKRQRKPHSQGAHSGEAQGIDLNNKEHHTSIDAV
jgi:hypothetical protein